MKPEPLFYHTRRLTVGSRVAISQPPDSFISYLRAEGVRYILLGSVQAREPGLLADLIAAHCESLDPIAFFPGRTYLFELRQAVDLDAAGTGCDAIRAYRVANQDRDFQARER